MSESSAGRPQRKLTRAELKAYRARRAAERQRIAAAQSNEQVQDFEAPKRDRTFSDTSYTMTRDDEFMVIRQDLVRLMIIVALLMALLAVATIILR